MHTSPRAPRVCEGHPHEAGALDLAEHLAARGRIHHAHGVAAPRVLTSFALRGDAESATVEEQRDELAALDEDPRPQRSRGDDVTGLERLRDYDVADVMQLRERIHRGVGRQAPIP